MNIGKVGRTAVGCCEAMEGGIRPTGNRGTQCGSFSLPDLPTQTLHSDTNPLSYRRTYTGFPGRSIHSIDTFASITAHRRWKVTNAWEISCGNTYPYNGWN